MLREIINKLQSKKSDLLKYKTDLSEKDIDISISQKNNIYKIEISDYISISNYIVKKKSNDKYNVLDLVGNGVLWNSEKQKVNKGTYYVISFDERIYNILFNEENIKIDEIIKIKTDEKNIMQERVITFNTITKEYHYFSAKHDETGSTFYTKSYNENIVNNLDAFVLSEEEAYDEISSVIYNLETIEGIEKIVDIGTLKTKILEKIDNNSCKIKNYKKI